MGVNENKMNVIDSKKRSYDLGKKLGEGSQGVIYKIKKQNYIAKLFRNSKDTVSVKSKINFLINLGLDKNIYAVPLKRIEQPSYGYIAELASGMVPLSDLKMPNNIDDPIGWYIKSGGLRRRYKLLISLASSLRKLHSKGLIYCDLSSNNVFMPKKVENTNVFLIDLDNLRYKTSIISNIYTPFYAAPELVKSTGPNSTMSDAFSFAVIAYELLTLNHPLIGDYVSDGEPELEEKALKGDLAWVDHKEDQINSRSTGFPSNKVIPKKLMDLFKRNFEEGLHDSFVRPSMSEWYDALILAQNELLTCSECKLDYPYNNFEECTFCSKIPQNITRIQMRRWEEKQTYNQNKNEIETSMGLEDKVYDEILIDESTSKDITAINFLIPGKESSESVLSITYLFENEECKLLLTPLNAANFQISPRDGQRKGGKPILLDSPKKIRVVAKESPKKKKYMLHLEDLSNPQRVLTID